MRKRAQRRFKPTFEEPKHVTHTAKLIQEKKTKIAKKNIWIFVAILTIFLLVLFFNTYFNASSGVAYNPDAEGLNKYYLSGPDPYYNMRLVKVTHETGKYPFYSEADPLLNYPLGRTGGRAPLMNMVALGFSTLLTPFMDEIDAIGLSMQFIPALFGALLVFPIYFIGKALVNKKSGLLAALFLAVIPIHIGSGHGSAFSLFDHDSFNLLLFYLTFMFLIYSIKEKDLIKSTLFATLGGISLAALSMVWVEAKFLFVVIAIYAIVQIIFDIFTNKIESKVFVSSATLLFTGYLVSFPVTFAKSGKILISTPLILCIGIAIFGGLYYIFGKKKIPWTLSLPSIVVLTAVGLTFLYFVKDISKTFPIFSPLGGLSNVVFGSGIYGNKVSMTIAEANTFGISHTVMSFGPILYWLGWGGFVLLLWRYFKDKSKREYLFIIVLFVIDLWLTFTAGRFLNDMAPLIAILSGFVTWFIVDKIDYKQMFRNIKSAGGGLHGIRRGIKTMHIIGILFIGLLVIFPNVFVTMDAAVPNYIYQKDDGNWSNFKYEMFGQGFSGAYGLSLLKEIYWSDAFNWLSKQDTKISSPNDRPAFISWWDYGFYESALGGHPTVADNFQDGIPPASNFHTATSEKEAVIVWIIRLLEGDIKNNNGKISDDVKNILNNTLGENNSLKIINWINNPEESPSYGTWIKEEYNKYIKKEIDRRMLKVGAQWADNAAYHDIVGLLSNLTDEQITWLYHDIQEATGLSIRYYGVEGYDRQIFNIFAFLADKSLVLVGAPEDDFIKIYYTGYKVDNNGNIIQKNLSWSAQEIKEMSNEEKRFIRVTGTDQKYKNAYFDTMFYRTYIGPYQTSSDGTRSVYPGKFQIPCQDMIHFYPEYISNISNPLLQYNFNQKAAVVLAKYYEGAYINGSVLFNGKPLDKEVTVSVRKDLNYTSGVSFPIDHDKVKISGTDTNPNATFNLIGGAGCKISVLRNLELSSTQAGPFVVTELIFNDTNSSDYSPITDEDAMRKSGSNYERNVTINIPARYVKGYIFNDTDGDGSYNSSVDEPLENATVLFYEINEFDQKALQQGNLAPVSEKTLLVDQQTTNESGYYNTTGLIPGWYVINVYYNDFLISQEIVKLDKNLTYNASMPKKASVEGITYYDTNLDGKYEPEDDEEVSNAEVDLYYQQSQYNEKFVESTTSDANGHYSFTEVIPGTYNIKATSDKYETTKSVTLKENETLTFNVSMDLIPVEVSGVAKYNGQPVDNVTIEFHVNESVDLNTAEENTTTTDKNGEYSIELSPGSYNITVYKSITQGTEDTIAYTAPMDALVLSVGQKTATKNFLDLEKQSVTIQGEVTYNNNPQKNVTVKFVPINESSLLTTATVESDVNGMYVVEILPGNYSISAIGLNLTGNNDNYSWTGSIIVSEDDIATGVTRDIVLAKEEH